MRPVITVGIPVYNVEQYVGKALLSVLNQSFPLPYEILVVDDKGGDNSIRIIRNLIAMHPNGNRVRIVSNSENLGPGCARTTIIENALGKYLFFLDSDDWADEQALEVLYSKAEQTNAELVVANIVHVYGDTFWQRTHYRENFVSRIGAGAYSISHKIENIHQEWWGKLWSVEFLKHTHIYNSNIILDDILPHFRMCAEIQRVAWVSNVVYYYRIRSNSLMTETFYEKARQTVKVYVKTIDDARILLQNRYYDVDGIYDMFLDRVRDAVSNIALFPFDDNEKQCIGTTIFNFAQVIPNIKVLHNKHNRFAYFVCRNSSSYKKARYAFMTAPNSFWGRCLRNILALF